MDTSPKETYMEIAYWFSGLSGMAWAGIASVTLVQEPNLVNGPVYIASSIIMCLSWTVHLVLCRELIE